MYEYAYVLYDTFPSPPFPRLSICTYHSRVTYALSAKRVHFQLHKQSQAIKKVYIHIFT